MEHRQHERAAVEDDFLAAEAGADIGFVTRRAPVEPREQEADDKDRNDADRDGYCEIPHFFYALSDDGCCAIRSAGAEMAMKLLASRSTSSTLAPTGSGAESRLARAATVCQLPKTSLRRTRPGSP